MQSFKYLCIDDEGIRRTGSIRARSQREAQRELLDRGWTLLELDRETFFDDSRSTLYALNSEERNRFLLKLSLLFASGVPIVTSLQGTARDEPTHFTEWVESVTSHVEQGHPLSEGLKLNKAGFSEGEIAQVKLGETTGSLSMILQRLAQTGRRRLEKEAELKAKLTYPLVQCVVMGGICLLLGTYLGPQLTGLVESLGGEQPAFTQWVTKLLEPKVVVTMAVVIGGALALLFFSWSTPAGRQVRNTLLDQVPPLRYLQQEILGARFCRDLAQLLDCGMDWQRSLRLCTTGSEAFDSETERFRKNLVETDFEVAVREAEHFSRLLKSLLMVGYETQKVPRLLELQAQLLEESVERRLDLFLSLLEPMLLLVVGLMVGVVVVASFLPLMSLVVQP